MTPFLLNVQRHSYNGLAPGDEVAWPMSASGGIVPITTEWDWGDGGKQQVTITETGATVTPTHTYQKAGIYRIVVRGHDASGREAAMTLTAVVSGPAPALPVVPTRSDGSLFLAWPILAVTGLVVLSFWLGEHHKLALAKVKQPAI